jgi:hypothetical protein
MRIATVALAVTVAGLFSACQHLDNPGSGNPAVVLPPASSPELAAARKLYMTKCSRCHKLYDPRKYDDTEWSTWMAKMSRKAKLKPGQPEVITDYVDKVLRHPAP